MPDYRVGLASRNGGEGLQNDQNRQQANKDRLDRHAIFLGGVTGS